MDQITQTRINFLHPLIKEKVRVLVAQVNSLLSSHEEIRIVQGFRTFAEQDALYAQGRTKPGPVVTNAMGGQSIHCYGLALDFALLIDGKEISWSLTQDLDKDGIADWMEVVKLFKANGFLWGGDWQHSKDYPHLEAVHEWQPLLVKYKKGDFISGTKFVRL